LIVELSVGGTKHSATLTEISGTGAKLRRASALATGDDVVFRAGDVKALGEVVWSEGTECAIAFDIPIAAAEVNRLRSLANLMTSLRED
jgi:hypothetical protein